MQITIINLWHVINGKWCHIVQAYEDGMIVCYTNGKLEDKISTEEYHKVNKRREVPEF